MIAYNRCALPYLALSTPTLYGSTVSSSSRLDLSTKSPQRKARDDCKRAIIKHQTTAHRHQPLVHPPYRPMRSTAPQSPTMAGILSITSGIGLMALVSLHHPLATTAFTSPIIHTDNAPQNKKNQLLISMVSSTPPRPPFQMPNAESIFGLFNFTAIMENADKMMEGMEDGGKEWPVNKKKKIVLNKNSTDDHDDDEEEEVAIIDKDSGDGNSDTSDNNISIKNTSEENKSSEWTKDPPIAKLEILKPFSMGEEDNMEDIASMLMEQPPTLRQLRGNPPKKLDKQKLKAVDPALNEEILGALRSAEEDLKEDLKAEKVENEGGGITTLSEKRAQIKAKAASLELENGEEETNKSSQAITEKYMAETPGAKLMKEYESIDVSSTSTASSTKSSTSATARYEDAIIDDEALLLANAQREAVEAIEMLKQAEAEAARWEDELAKIEAVVAKEITDGEKGPFLKKSIVPMMGELPSKSAPTHSIKEDYRKMKENESINYENTTETMTSPKLSQETAAVTRDDSQDEQVTDETDVPSPPSPPTPPLLSLETIAAQVTSFLPAPPPDPPTESQIDNNHDATNENLSEINRDLQQKLEDQKRKLGRLRKRANELEQELQRVKRTKKKGVEDEVNVRTEEVRMEYEGQLKVANDGIAKLEEQQRELTTQLKEERIKLNDAFEAKERVAAEYGYIVKSYAELKGSVESNTTDWENKLDSSQKRIASLEQKLEETTSDLQKYQIESQNWREECTNKADQLDTFTARVTTMQSTIEDLQLNIASTQTNIDKIKLTAKQEEYSRSRGNLQKLSEEYELLLRKKSKKIGELRKALRVAQSEKRQIERHSEKEKGEALAGLREELTGEIDGLKATLKERDLEIGRMEGLAREAEGVKEEREQLLAEIMFLTKSFEELQTELTTNAEMIEDCIQSFEKEAEEKDARILTLESQLNNANEKIGTLESRVDELTIELERERSINANLTATVSELQNELELARTNAEGYDDIIAILRAEAETYQAQLSDAQGETASYKQKKMDLEELIEKTKDSLIDEKKRVYDALEEKDTQIANLDRELAEKLNDAHTSASALKKSKSKLKLMTKSYNSEKVRADALDEKIQKLNQFAAGMHDADSSKEEIDRLAKLLEDVTISNEEYKSLVSTYQTKTKFLSQQLLLSGQNMSLKQSSIASLKEELSDAMSQAAAAVEDKQSTAEEISELRSKLDEVQSKSTVWKAQANGMIIELTSKLKEKDGAAMELQNKFDELSEERERSKNEADEALVKEIAELKSAMEDAQTKAKEKMRHKNQSLKEMEDAVASLTTAMEDLKRDKDQIVGRLEEEIRRHKEDIENRDRAVHEAEDKLAKEHIAAMTEMENEMMETTRQLEMEIRSLKKKAAEEKVSQQGYDAAAAGMKSTGEDHTKVREMEEALRRSKEKEVSLINQNMKMQHKIQDMQLQQLEERRNSAVPGGRVVDEDEDGNGEGESAVELPTYYKEKQRPVVIRVVGNAMRKIFRRKRKLL